MGIITSGGAGKLAQHRIETALAPMVLALFLVLTACQTGIVDSDEAMETGESASGEDRELFWCALTGLQFEQEEPATRRPLAVVLDNSSRSRPQRGLQAADWVLELPVEGGMTRLLAVYRTELPAEVGPVRSLRPYFLERSLEFDAAVAHVGYSPQARAQLQAWSVVSLNQFNQGELFWRDGSLPRPHNVFTEMTRLEEYLEATGQESYSLAGGPDFMQEGEKPRGGLIEALHIEYPAEQVSYHYEPTRDVFQRYVSDMPHVDGSQGDVIEVDNVVVQHVGAPRVLDAVGRLEVSFSGSGRATICRQGVLQEGNWEKSSPQGWTRWVSRSGQRVLLKPGTTWVQVVTPGVRVTIDWKEE